MFTELMNTIWEEFARYIFNVEVEVEGGNGAGPEQAPAAAVGRPPGTPAPPAPSATPAAPPRTSPARWPAAAAAGGAGQSAEESPRRSVAAPVETRAVDDEERIGRNDPCWCGSGKKYKKCHGA